jgi:hypothetical protein
MLALYKLTRMTIVVGSITTVSLIFAILALSDIHSGTEPDLSAEWATVRATFLLVAVFIALTISCIWRAYRRKL